MPGVLHVLLQQMLVLVWLLPVVVLQAACRLLLAGQQDQEVGAAQEQGATATAAAVTGTAPARQHWLPLTLSLHNR